MTVRKVSETMNIVDGPGKDELITALAVYAHGEDSTHRYFVTFTSTDDGCEVKQNAVISGVSIDLPTGLYRIVGKITNFDYGFRAAAGAGLCSKTAPWCEFTGDYDPRSHTGVFTVDVWYGDDK